MPTAIVTHKGVSRVVQLSAFHGRTDAREYSAADLLELAGLHGWWNLPRELQEPAREAVEELVRREGVGSHHSIQAKRFSRELKRVVKDGVAPAA